MERKRLFGLAGVCAVAMAAALLFTLLAEHWRTESPDRAFVAVAQIERHYALVSVLPGQHGDDKPGYVTIYRGNRPCGSVWVPLVSLAYGLRWDIDARPRRATILTATWNLEACRIERMFTGVARRIAGASPTKAAA